MLVGMVRTGEIVGVLVTTDGRDGGKTQRQTKKEEL